MKVKTTTDAAAGGWHFVMLVWIQIPIHVVDVEATVLYCIMQLVEVVVGAS